MWWHCKLVFCRQSCDPCFFDEAVKTSHYESFASCVVEDADAPAAFAPPPPAKPLSAPEEQRGWSGDREREWQPVCELRRKLALQKVLIVSSYGKKTTLTECVHKHPCVVCVCTSFCLKMWGASFAYQNHFCLSTENEGNMDLSSLWCCLCLPK